MDGREIIKKINEKMTRKRKIDDTLNNFQQRREMGFKTGRFAVYGRNQMQTVNEKIVKLLNAKPMNIFVTEVMENVHPAAYGPGEAYGRVLDKRMIKCVCCCLDGLDAALTEILFNYDYQNIYYYVREDGEIEIVAFNEQTGQYEFTERTREYLLDFAGNANDLIFNFAMRKYQAIYFLRLFLEDNGIEGGEQAYFIRNFVDQTLEFVRVGEDVFEIKNFINDYMQWYE